MSTFYAATIIPFIFGLTVMASIGKLVIYWQIRTQRTPRLLASIYLLVSLCFLYLVPALALSVFWRDAGRVSLFVSLILVNWFEFRELWRHAQTLVMVVKK